MLGRSRYKEVTQERNLKVGPPILNKLRFPTILELYESQRTLSLPSFLKLTTVIDLPLQHSSSSSIHKDTLHQISPIFKYFIIISLIHVSPHTLTAMVLFKLIQNVKH